MTNLTDINELIEQAHIGRRVEIDRDGPFIIKRQKELIPDTGMASWVSDAHGNIEREWKTVLDSWIKVQPEAYQLDLRSALRDIMRDEGVLTFVRCEFNSLDNIALALTDYVRHAVINALGDSYFDTAEGGEYFESLFAVDENGNIVLDNNLRILCGLLALVMRHMESERVA